MEQVQATLAGKKAHTGGDAYNGNTGSPPYAVAGWALQYFQNYGRNDSLFEPHDMDFPGLETVAIGTGRTIDILIDAIVKSNAYKGKLIVPANKGTRKYLESWVKKGYRGIEIGTADDLIGNDYIYYDGADELVIPEENGFNGSPRAPVEERMMVMKGADKNTGDPGIEGCIHDEWKVANNARTFIIVAGSGNTKVVPYLGYRCRLPVEVLPAAGHDVEKYIKKVLRTDDVRVRKYEGAPFVTESGNYMYDAAFSGVKLNSVRHAMESLVGHTGIVEIGISKRPADIAIVGYTESKRRVKIYNREKNGEKMMTRVVSADNVNRQVPALSERTYLEWRNGILGKLTKEEYFDWKNDLAGLTDEGYLEWKKSNGGSLTKEEYFEMRKEVTGGFTESEYDEWRKGINGGR